MHVIGDFNINLFSNDSIFFGEKTVLNSKSIPSDV